MVYVMVSRILHLHGLLVYRHITTSVIMPRFSFFITMPPVAQCAVGFKVYLTSQMLCYAITPANLTNADSIEFLMLYLFRGIYIIIQSIKKKKGNHECQMGQSQYLSNNKA